MGTVKPELVPPLTACLSKIHIVCRNDARIAGGYTHHVASYFKFGTHFRVPSRADTKFNPILWAPDQSEFKFGESTLLGCEEKRMQS